MRCRLCMRWWFRCVYMCACCWVTHVCKHTPRSNCNTPLHNTQTQAAVLTGLSLAFATIPEELPLLIAGVLAVGALALAQRRVRIMRVCLGIVVGVYVGCWS